MNRLNSIVLFLFLAFTCGAHAASDKLASLVKSVESKVITETDLQPLQPTRHQRLAARIAKDLLAFYHYRRDLRFDDNFSKQVYRRYLDSLDPAKVYLRQSDLDDFAKYQTAFDNALTKGELTPVFTIFDGFRERWVERYNYAIKLLDGKFDFTRDEEFLFDRENANWPADRSEQNELWRLRVKNDLIGLILADKTEAQAKDLLRKRYKAALRRMAQTDEADVFRQFMNVATSTIEPHTAYFSPRVAENFNIEMSLSLEGIGAVLQTEDVYTKVVRLVPGGPADRSEQLRPGDMIVGVAQDDEEMVDVIGWRLDDVVDLIRGKAGTKVRLEILPKGAGPDAPTRQVVIVREKIKLEDQAARKKVLELTIDGQKHRFGVITLPIFYIDFEAYYRGNPNYKSTTRDVRKLLRELKREKVEGIIIDLRGNGGGSLAEATQLTGLFIDQGPVVQEEDASRKVRVLRDDDRGVEWDGPLVVMVNRFSASASEIFAAAIQDYRRGLVVGSTTFGKGTVQQIQDLDRWNPDPKEGSLGQLKYTVARFYRVNGDSTQLRGVTPDIRLPALVDVNDFGEAALENPLPWAKINAVAFKPFELNIDLKQLQTMSDQRVAASKAYQILLEEYRLGRQYDEEKVVSLNLEKRRAQRNQIQQQELALLNKKRQLLGLPPLKNIEDHSNSDDKKLEDFDPELKEAAHILSDFMNALAHSEVSFKKAS